MTLDLAGIRERVANPKPPTSLAAIAESLCSAERDIPALLEAVDQARRFAVQFEAENAHMRAVIAEIATLVAGMRMPCWCITYKHTATEAVVCEACLLRGLLTDLTEMP